MRRQSYFSFGNFNQENNVSQSTHPLVLNCAGYETLEMDDLSRIGNRADYYVMLVDKGTMRFTLEQKNTQLKAGDLVVISPHTPYCYTCRTEDGCSYFWMHITGSQAEEYFRWAELPTNIVHSLLNHNTLELQFKQLFNLYRNQDDLFHMEAMGQVMGILTALGRGIQKTNMLEKSITYMHRHYAEPLSVQKLAQMEAKSVSQFRKNFVSKFGQSPKQYLTELRLSVACHMLRTTLDKVESIAKQCGYDDYHYFCRLFRTHIGCTPTEYRN